MHSVQQKHRKINKSTSLAQLGFLIKNKTSLFSIYLFFCPHKNDKFEQNISEQIDPHKTYVIQNADSMFEQLHKNYIVPNYNKWKYFSQYFLNYSARMLKPSFLKYLKHYLLHQTHPSPLFFFLLLFFKDVANFNGYLIVLHILALYLAIFRQYSFLYMLPTFIYTSNDLLTIFFLVTSLLSCTHKWKIFLFLFTSMDCYLSLGNSRPQFIGTISAGMCILIYKNLIFQRNKDNREYFIRFFMFSIVNAAYLLANTIQIWLKVGSLLVVVFLAGYLSRAIIENRMEEIRSLQLQNIKSPLIMARYIDMLLEDFEVLSLSEAKLAMHAKKCKIKSCYCKKEKESSQFYLRQMFENFIKKLGSLGDENLWEYYIDFHLKKDQVLRAYYYLIKWQPTSYFSMISKMRSEAKIVEFLQKVNYSNPYVKEYIYALDYDKKCQHLSTQIHEILKIKMYFWKQVTREYLSLQKLKKIGCQIVTRMYKLNLFYSYTIKQYEKYVYCFDSTILYAMYLISTTNFKDYAKGIIKNTSKLMQEVLVNERNASQTFAIRAIIKNQQKSYLKKVLKSFPAQKDLSTELKLNEIHQNQFRLIIDAVSSGFCKMVNIPKHQIIGSELNALIPNCYKDIHNVRLTQILDFNSDSIEEFSPSRVLHTELKLLVKGADDELFSALICIKYHMDIHEGVTFLSTIKTTPDNKSQALITFDGVLMQKQKGFPSEVMKHSQVKKYLQEMKQTWFLYKTVKEQRFSLMINRNSCQITISSPYAFLMADKQCLKEKEPPLHIQLLNEENSKHKGVNSIHPKNNADYQMKKMQKMINYEQQSSAKSSSKAVNSTVTIISNFSQNNSVPIYKYIIATFLLLLICNITLNLIFNLMPITSWDNTSSLQNPIVDNINLYKIEISTWKAMCNLQDSIHYNKYRSGLNASRIRNYYSGEPYPLQVTRIFRDFTNELQDGLSSLWSNYSNILKTFIFNRLDQKILVNNKLNGTLSTRPPKLTLSYQQIILLFGVDNKMVSRGMNYNNLLLPGLLIQVQSQLGSLQPVYSTISASLGSAFTQQVVISTIFIVIMVVLVVPMRIVLGKRFKTHQRVFDLLSSIDCEQVTKQIQSLLYISNILNNYSESQQKLKLNVLDYQANAINPKHTTARERKASVMNELVLGLEKFDIVSNEGDVHRVEQSQNLLMRKLKTNGGEEDQVTEMFGTIRSEMFGELSKIAQFKGRKRSGQLDMSGSQYDETKWTTPRHCAIYILLLSFIPFLVNSFMGNWRAIDYLKRSGSIINDIYNDLLDLNSKLGKAKTYLWQGKDSFKKKYHLTNQLTLLDTLLSETLNYSVYNGQQIQWISPAFAGIPKLEQYTTSLRVIDSELSAVLKNLVEFRYNLQSSGYFSSNQSINNNISLAQNLYQKIFYLQTLSNSKADIAKSIANNLKEAMFGYCGDVRDQKQVTLVVLILWSVISFVIGLCVTFRMKQQFFKEVYILTFLNDEMLLKNKRVQSYLQNLSKNTYF